MPRPDPAALASDLTRWIDRWRPPAEAIVSIDYSSMNRRWSVHVSAITAPEWLAAAIPHGTNRVARGDRRDMDLDGFGLIWFVTSGAPEAHSMDSASLLAELGGAP